MQKIIVGDICVDVVLKKIKNLHLSVYPPLGRVRISAPLRMRRKINLSPFPETNPSRRDAIRGVSAPDGDNAASACSSHTCIIPEDKRIN